MPSGRRRRSEGGNEDASFTGRQPAVVGRDSADPGSFKSRAAVAAAAEAAVMDRPGTSSTSRDSKPGPLKQLASPTKMNSTASVSSTTTNGTPSEVIEAEVLDDRPSDADFAWWVAGLPVLCTDPGGACENTCLALQHAFSTPSRSFQLQDGETCMGFAFCLELAELHQSMSYQTVDA
eukprot:458110-Pelagomonas_calceolata.AAC.2